MLNFLVQRQALLWLAGVLVVLSLGMAGFALGGEGAAATDTTWNHIQEQRVLAVGIDISFPPFGYVENNQAQGVDAALAHELGLEFGVAVRFVPVNYDGMYDTLLTGEVDILIAAVRPEPFRYVDQFRYTSPYFDAGYVLVGRREPPLVLQAIESTAQVAVVEASAGDTLAQRALENDHINFQVVALLSVEDVVAAVAEGGVDFAILDAVSAFDAQQQYPVLQIATERLSFDPYVIALRRTDWKLHQEIEQVLYQWRRDGTLATILADWL